MPPQDLAVYQILGQLATLEIAEMCARSGANCGSLFLDLRFRELVRTLLADHPAHLDAASLAYFMHSFSETEKITYRGDIDDGARNFPLPSRSRSLVNLDRFYVQLYVLQCGRPA